MYDPVAGVAATAAGAGTGLAFTGLNATWDVCVAFALLAAGLAVLRIVPRLRSNH
jgi:hypothetical protein